jgi:hypothetical protein
MKSKVYFVAVKDAGDIPTVCDSLRKLLDASRVLDVIGKDDRVAVKIHFGEEGNTGFVNPAYARVICDGISQAGGRPFLSDANTLYKGRRTNAKDHLEIARAHGFTRKATGVDVVIPDDTIKENTVDIPIDGTYITMAKIARLYADADALAAITHFKGHMITGFGGAIKNLGMGCATREGKLMQHNDNAPVFYGDNCIGCGACAEVCPVGAISMVDGKSRLDKAQCIGCANCVGVCPTMALFVDMAAGDKVQLKMAEYAAAALKGKEKRSVFINFAVNINKECDCWGLENPRIAPDIGICASFDPVSIDKACFDLVNKACGKDVFKQTHPEQDGTRQLLHAQELGMGTVEYELIPVGQ